MRRAPSFPPSAPRRRPPQVEAELEKLHRETSVAAPEPEPKKDTAAGVSTRLKERLEELRGAKRQAQKKKLALIAGILTVVGLLAWLVAFSPVLALRVDDLEISGANEYVSKDDVISVVKDYDQVPLVRLDTGDLRQRLMEDYPIKDARFARVWPTGLKVSLEPRTPVAATPTKKGYAILDGKGVKLGTSKKEVEGLPIIEVDKDADALDEIIDAVLAVMDTLPPSLREQVETVGAKSPHEVEFRLDNGARVMWGSAQESDLKASVLEVLMEVPARVYNVAAPMSPITS